MASRWLKVKPRAGRWGVQNAAWRGRSGGGGGSGGGPPPPESPSTDFSAASNSQYIALLFEDF